MISLVLTVQFCTVIVDSITSNVRRKHLPYVCAYTANTLSTRCVCAQIIAQALSHSLTQENIHQCELPTALTMSDGWDFSRAPSDNSTGTHRSANQPPSFVSSSNSLHPNCSATTLFEASVIFRFKHIMINLCNEFLQSVTRVRWTNQFFHRLTPTKMWFTRIFVDFRCASQSARDYGATQA